MCYSIGLMSSAISKSKTTVSDVIADRFIKSLEAGVCPWQKPWASLAPQNAVSKKAYRGVNLFLLSMFGGDDYFLTFNQAKKLGGCVQKGSKGLPVTYWKKIKSKKEAEKDFLVCRYYTVFALKDCGLPDFKRANKVINFEPLEQAEAILAKNTCPINFGGSSAHYTPAIHAIQMPPKDSFKSVANFYAVLFHEIGHSLKQNANDFGKESYAKEELVAELFASIALSHCGLLEQVNFDNSASYLASWLKALNNDKSLIQKASTEAFKRWENLMGKAEEAEAEEEEEEEEGAE